MKLASWNVNSLKVRLPQVVEWLNANQPDVLCLQETKLQDAFFPADEIAEKTGYQSIYAGQKTYNGVALLSKETGGEVGMALPGLDDSQKRFIAATYGNIRVICVYVPNGERVDSDKYIYKLNWLATLSRFLGEERERYQKVAVLGDFNIAPEDRDVYDPEAWKGKVLCSDPERSSFRELLNIGFVDSFRLFEQPAQTYTWWDYRTMAFRRNRGLRIDHILLSHEMATDCTACWVDKEPRKLERPSDHAPIAVELVGVGHEPQRDAS
ncbi:exodeoxyribonuclease III [Nitrosomonas halophila]|jgi:exodeoxyribonuclease III|uniref:Exodeoxyribonuclease-3 n=1 Tax=Nitrosomonas halophila TaxID=44576 RepID=A0A1H3GVS6_9PROT|nr:exodeoxyribonuclease III [Nitrosomonas halophila]SDY07433.1 exodeoxyribonuclease-3 [Nitrosomonas halophila]